MDPLSYAWDFDGDGQYDDAVGPSPVFSAAALDGYEGHSVTVGLRVTDDTGASDEDTATIEITNVAPTVRIFGAPVASPEGTPIDLASTITDPGVSDTHTYNWVITRDGAPFASGTKSAVQIVPMSAGTYLVSLTVADDDGGIGTYSQAIEVVNVAFAVTIDGAPASGSEGTEIVLSSTVEDPSGASDHTYLWTVTKDGEEFALGPPARAELYPR